MAQGVLGEGTGIKVSLAATLCASILGSALWVTSAVQSNREATQANTLQLQNLEKLFTVQFDGLKEDFRRFGDDVTKQLTALDTRVRILEAGAKPKNP